MSFILKTYEVTVDGHSPVEIIAKSRAQASYRTFEAYRRAYDQVTFKDFLKMRPLIRVVDGVENFGEPIKVTPYGTEIDAYFIEKRYNTVSFAEPNCDRVRHIHELEADTSMLSPSPTLQRITEK